MGLTAAHGTGVMGIPTATHLLGFYYIFRLNQSRAFWFVAVKAFGYRNFPFLLAVFKSRS
jgi:hypothetical protein